MIEMGSFSYYLNTYLSHNYLGGFDCATAPPNVVCMDGNIFSGDPMFTDTAQGNYAPLPCSPLANAGSNAFVGPEDSVDIVGTPRIQGGRVDIGAFESPGPRVTTTPEVQGACGPSANGSVSFFPQNACPPYTGQWSNGAVSGNGFTQLYAGNYAFTLTDARGATCTATASIPHYEAFTLESFSEPVQCGDTLGGRGWANVSGGLPPYVFLWDNGSKDSLQTELPAGIHALRVQDAHGCKDQTNVVVEGIGGLKIAVTSTPVHCYGVPDGTLTIQALNGKAPYTYIWENGPATPEYQGLGPGVYKGTLTDALGCRIVWVLPLSEPDSLHVEAVVTPSTDALTHNGRIQVTGISGGTAPFTLSWSNGAIGALLENLAPGVYTCTLTDAEGCTQTIIYTITLEVGTEEAGLGFSFALWPNPARDAIFIRDLGQTGTVQCSIYNALGVLMYERSSAQLDEAVDIRHWPAGVYTCVVQSAGGKRWIERFGVGR
ncbi:MAG: T9SS type A sorting domain-containing protein [Bacteroidetes bacterium]|nr:T9SS type A sorting domain-containing protein [Bacteroidota bacterium]